MKEKTMAGIAVRTGLAAGVLYSCYERKDVDAVRKCTGDYFNRKNNGWNFGDNFAELERCLNSC